jgi:hypothetical protein
MRLIAENAPYLKPRTLAWAVDTVCLRSPNDLLGFAKHLSPEGPLSDDTYVRGELLPGQRTRLLNLLPTLSNPYRSCTYDAILHGSKLKPTEHRSLVKQILTSGTLANDPVLISTLLRKSHPYLDAETIDALRSKAYKNPFDARLMSSHFHPLTPDDRYNRFPPISVNDLKRLNLCGFKGPTKAQAFPSLSDMASTLPPRSQSGEASTSEHGRGR